MKITLPFLAFLFSGAWSLFAQTTISGNVTDVKGVSIMGANIFIEGTYDGATSSENGNFYFTTSATGLQTIIVSYLSFQTFRKEGGINEFSNLRIVLREDVNALDAVVLSAGSFKAGEKARVSVLKPLDIVTTAGSAGDIVAALQTLPGTQNVGESGRLFVRGGEAGETQTYVDGIRVAQPYGATIQNLPTRGRFSPFLFSGISFSTGGYSAEYGEALSSVLLLNTEDIALQDKTDISFMSVGLGVGHTKKWEKSSLSLNTAYVNLAPYQFAVPENIDWNKPFESLSGEVIYRQQLKNGLWKVYAAFDASNFDLNQKNINTTEKVKIDLKNNNFYLNTTYKNYFGNNWQIFTGISYGYGTNNIGIDASKVKNTEHAVHLKTKLGKKISNGVRFSFGVDYFRTQFDEDFIETPESVFNIGYQSQLGAVYTETDFLFSNLFAVKVGLRASYNDLLEEKLIAPRISMGYKTGQNSQFSLAYGIFTQIPESEFIKYSDQFNSEKASHYILNYQFSKNRKLFRAEVYYKAYSDLVKYDTEAVVFNSAFTNTGSGYATGLDIFWRDGKTIKNLEYWVSYSYIDSERDYRNFPTQATLSFIADHTASLVTKYWIQDWRSQVGFSHLYSSGRPYNNPNEIEFMGGKTKDYNSLSFNWAYLLSAQKILYFSVSNVLGSKNVFGYEYATTPNNEGIFNRRAITPTADRFFFIGFFWTISEDKKRNQLDNL
ncbi:MAG: TonB-dependent receptor [Bacteroidetes bacterium HGW-Bacteroidetes-2]|jgi:membrane-bound inhibitor of C-type lysozyme|nr:MAG: TonB-dependent receptor [Bacteroidetes bacterium HGW-Bacteroidetes-2]